MSATAESRPLNARDKCSGRAMDHTARHEIKIKRSPPQKLWALKLLHEGPMPQKILHCLFSVEEEREMRANGFGLDTHGIQHVVIQFERGRKKVADLTTAVTTRGPQPTKALIRAPRPKNRACKHCGKLFSGPGHWKHERFCLRMQKEWRS